MKSKTKYIKCSQFNNEYPVTIHLKDNSVDMNYAEQQIRDTLAPANDYISSVSFDNTGYGARFQSGTIFFALKSILEIFIRKL